MSAEGKLSRNTIRAAIRETAKERVDAFLTHGAMCPMPSVVERLNNNSLSPTENPRIERYAEVTELALGMPYVIEGDGESAHFKDFQLLPPEPDENPYRTYRRSIQDTFAKGWERFEQDMEKHHPGELSKIRRRYQDLVDNDSTSQQTGDSINYNYFRTGVELGPEMAYFALKVGLAIDNTTDIPSLKEDTNTPGKRTTLALQLSRDLIARASSDMLSIFWTKRRITLFADWDKLQLIKRADEKYAFTQRGGKFEPYNPATDPSPTKPLIGCMALFFKLRPDDEYVALENAIFAAFNEASKIDLFNPDLARKAWNQRKIIYDREGFTQVLAAIPEDVTKARETVISFNATTTSFI